MVIFNAFLISIVKSAFGELIFVNNQFVIKTLIKQTKPQCYHANPKQLKRKKVWHLNK